MANYSLGFILDYNAIKLIVAKKTGLRWEILNFFEAESKKFCPSDFFTKVGLNEEGKSSKYVSPIEIFAKKELEERGEFISLLLQIYEDKKFQPYRSIIEGGREKVSVAVGIPSAYSWSRFIPLSSLDELYNSRSYQNAIEETLRMYVPYPPELLYYDTRRIEDAKSPCISLLVSTKNWVDNILGTTEKEGVFAQAGFPSPDTIVSQTQALATLYSILSKDKGKVTVLLYLGKRNVQVMIIEGNHPHKIENIRIPDNIQMPDIGQKSEDKNLFLSIYLLSYLKITLMYGSREGKLVDKIVLFGDNPYISLKKIKIFLTKILGHEIDNMDTRELSKIFPDKDTHRLHKNIQQYTLTSKEMSEFHITHFSSEGQKTSYDLLDIFESKKIINDNQENINLVKKNVSGDDLISQESIEKDPLAYFIYSKMIEHEKNIKIEIIEPHFLTKFLKYIRNSFSSASLSENRISLFPFSSAAKIPLVDPSSDQIMPFALAVHALNAEKKDPNLANRSGQKKISAFEEILYSYLPDLTLNALIITILVWSCILFFQDLQKKDQINHLKEKRRVALSSLKEVGMTESNFDWASDLKNAPLLADPLNFSKIGDKRIFWAKILREIAEALPLDTVLLSISLNNFDERERKEIAVLTIRGQSPCVSQVIIALKEKISVSDIFLESPVQSKGDSDEEDFLLTLKIVN
ncbi:MAG: hypothetical protein HUU50_02385 [Candidatus Brocadiae bacterium]|nr:hypothetical protein [Candidatus Brocadiia bacterium]